jgi:hypothetical protein
MEDPKPRITWSETSGVTDRDRIMIRATLGPWSVTETYDNKEQRQAFFKYRAHDGDELTWDYEKPIRKRLRTKLLQKIQDFVDGYKTGKHEELRHAYMNEFIERIYDADKDEECIKPPSDSST